MRITKAQIWRLITHLDNAITGYKNGSRILAEEKLPLLGLETDRVVEGLPLRAIMVPQGPVDQVERLMAIEDVGSLICGDRMSHGDRRALKEMIGTNAGTYVASGECTAERYARLLWVFGTTEGVRVEALDKDAGTLLVNDGGVIYGVENNVLVGGSASGQPMPLVLNETFYKEKYVKFTGNFLELNRALRMRIQGSDDPDMYRAVWDLAMALWQRSKWDKFTPFTSILNLIRYRSIRPYLEDMEEIVMNSDDPLLDLNRAMVGRAMTVADFRNYFGQLRHEKQYKGNTARMRLITKLHTIPFLKRKKNNEQNHRNHRQSR